MTERQRPSDRPAPSAMAGLHALLASLPAPVHGPAAPEPLPAAQVPSVALARVGSTAPPYGQRAGFVPRKEADFGGGGAYPECHVAQYPLECGRKAGAGGRAGTLAVSVQDDGKVDFSALVKQGKNAGKTVHSTHNALVPKLHERTAEDLARPDAEAEEATLAATRAVVEARVNGTLAANQPKSLPSAPGAPQYIKYTPAKQGPEYNSGASHRIIKMHTVAVDPLQPPKFAHKKVPRGPGSPPVPVMHSPPRPVSKADAADWKVPPCVSSWKNAKGYTIPLDKRLAADGRGLTDAAINDGFARLSEALYVAESKAREAVEARAAIQRQLLAREKDRKEEELRALAQAARLARGGVAMGVYAAEEAEARLPPPPPLPGSRPPAMDFDADEGLREGPPPGGYPPPPPPPAVAEPPESAAAAARREEIREERRRERERERRLEARDAGGGKRSKVTRDRERDISEVVALGQARVGGGTGEQLYDQRLFNQSAGLDAGFGADDGYNTFDKPLFADRGASLYAPRPVAEDSEAPEEAARTFRPDRGFAGTEGGAAGAAPSARPAGPVQFEREAGEEDPFGLGAFISDVRRGGGAKPK